MMKQKDIDVDQINKESQSQAPNQAPSDLSSGILAAHSNIKTPKQTLSKHTLTGLYPNSLGEGIGEAHIKAFRYMTDEIKYFG